jgi:hypothetical protein
MTSLKHKPSGISRAELAQVAPSFLDDLNLDLEDIMSQEEIDNAISQTRREKAIPKAARGEPKPETVPKARPSPWRAIKTILLLCETQCSCGATFQHPAAKMPLAHFMHIHKPDTFWEVACHPSTLNPALPKETRILIETVTACQSCFTNGA